MRLPINIDEKLNILYTESSLFLLFYTGQGPPYDLTVDICALLVLFFGKHDLQKNGSGVSSFFTVICTTLTKLEILSWIFLNVA